MKPLAELRGAQHLRGLLFDIDDTLTTEGRLTAVAFSALERLHASERLVIAVTGRPAGWCDHIARMWPVHAVVGENCAFYFRYQQGKLHKRYQDGEAERAAKRSRLGAIARHILSAVPGSALSSDQPYRETDLAIDYCEDVPRLSIEEAERIAALMRAAGLNAKLSSIHVNGWFGSYDKLAMTKTLFAEHYGTDLDAANSHYAFAGDSPNDAPMFDYFAHSVGVANVARFTGHLASAPKYVTQRASGAGFAELVAHLLGET